MNTKAKESIRRLTLGAMLVAMSVVVGILCKTFLNFGGGLFRITFENLPIILSGIMFGPIMGAAVGVATDIISYLLSAQGLPPNLIVTFGAAVIGFCAGFVSKHIVKKNGYAQIIAAGASAHLLGSMIIKPVGLYVFYGWAVLWRIPLYCIIAPLEIIVLCLLYKNSSFRRITGLDRGHI